MYHIWRKLSSKEVDLAGFFRRSFSDLCTHEVEKKNRRGALEKNTSGGTLAKRQPAPLAIRSLARYPSRA